MIRRPPRSTQSRSSAASDVYKRQLHDRTAGRQHRPRRELRPDDQRRASGVLPRHPADGNAAEYILEVQGLGTQGLDRTESTIRIDAHRLPVMVSHTEKGDVDAA